MSAARFKSKDDYFSRRDSSLAERVIAAKSPKPGRKRSVEGAIPSTLLRVHFCKTVEQFQIEGRGRYRKGEYPLDDALRSHLGGEETVLVNPLSPAGETAFTVVRFDLSDAMDLPFSKARQYGDELLNHGIPSLIEVAEGGKGHYHLWIFHEEPVTALPFSEALARLGRRMFGVMLETVPSILGDEYIPLPLQGESALLQRRVFVNAVGKMIKDQGNVLQSIEYCPKTRSEAFIAAMTPQERPVFPARPAVPVPPRPVIPVAMPAPKLAPVPEFAPKPVISPRPVMSLPVEESSPPAARTEPVAPPRVDVPEAVEAPETGVESAPEEISPIEVTAIVPEAEPVIAAPLPKAVFLVFSRDGKEFAIEASSVARIMGAREMVLHDGSGRVRGTVEAAGRTVSVLDSGETAGIPPRGRIVLLRGTRAGYGLLADDVAGPERLGRVSRETAIRLDGGLLAIPDVENLIPKAGERPARPERTAKVHIPGGRYVLFTLGGHVYGISAGMVREALPGSVRDVSSPNILYRGGSVPFFDFRVEHQASRRERILVIEIGGVVAGVCVDAIEGIRTFAPGEVDSGTGAVAGDAPVIGAFRSGEMDRTVFIIDPVKMRDRITASGSPA